MLADTGDFPLAAGVLDAELHLPGQWFEALLAFLQTSLMSWRDDPRRPAETGETRLTAQLSQFLNSACRHSNWDYLQFTREHPDEVRRERAIDIAVAPRAATIWVGGRRYSHYDTLLPIECKRLPTPLGANRDDREYVYSRFSSAGGIQRFKQGLHAAAHRQAAMIGYIQTDDVTLWKDQVSAWLTALASEQPEVWSKHDAIDLIAHDTHGRSAILRSTHRRPDPAEPILINHLWIQI